MHLVNQILLLRIAAPRSTELFDPPKLLMRRTDDKLRVALDTSDAVCVNSCHVIKLKENYEDLNREYLFLLAVLNSPFCQWVFEQSNPQMIGKTFAEIKVVYVERLPIPPATSADKSSLAKLAKRASKLADDGDDEGLAMVDQQIDEIVYRLFDLSSDDITQIKTSLASTRSVTDDEPDDIDEED